VVVWLLGGAIALKFGNAVNLLSGIALIGFGAWFSVSSWLEIRHHGQHEPRAHFGHSHAHRHAGGTEHRHYHEHHDQDWHAITETIELAAPVHEHEHRRSFRTALLLIVGSSPMVEGIPAFFAAAKFGVQQLAIMAIVFGACTIATYIVLCFLAVSGLERIALGKLERYGEVISGAFIAVIGIAFLFLR
jgi:ABC-type nickel/cobalt efflux system permease component RcnA